MTLSYKHQIDEKLIIKLTNLTFLSQAKNIIFIGPPGVGKTHLAISIGIKAACARKRVIMYNAEDLINELTTSEVSGRLSHYLDCLSRIDLLIIDELGYLTLSKQSAALFFKLISERQVINPLKNGGRYSVMMWLPLQYLIDYYTTHIHSSIHSSYRVRAIV